MRLLIAAALLLAAPVTCLAADISHKMFRIDGQEKLVIRLSGQIAKGDADTVAGIIDANIEHTFADYTDIVVSLDSPGGSFVEGLALADVLRKKYAGTYVDDGAECLSACALAFMAGTDATGDSTWPDRKLHPRARLGFHSPSLTVPSEGSVPVAQVGAAYSVALKSLAGIVSRMEQMEFPRSLLETMLDTPPQSMRIISTIDDINRWGILLATDFPRGSTAPEEIVRVCRRMENWAKNLAAGDIIEPDEFALSQVETRSVRQQEHEDTIQRFLIDEMDVEYCYVIHRSYSGGGGARFLVRSFNGDEAMFANLSATPSFETYLLDAHFQAADALIASYEPAATGRLDPPAAKQKPKPAVAAPGGTCLVYSRAGLVIDQEPCTADFSTALVERYTWPSGAVTVIDRRNPPVSINGKPIAATSRTPKGLYCVGNPATGNAFCYRPG